MKKVLRNLYTDIAGNPIGVYTYEYGKGQPGLYIQGGVHGGEVTYFIFEELHKFLKKNESKLKKKICLAPIINPVAWSQRIYYYTVGKFDLYKGGDWNRSYPGKESTMSARNSQKIFNLIRDYEFAIDLHTARTSKPYVIYMEKALENFVKVLGIPYNYFIDLSSPLQTKYKGVFNEAMKNINKPAVTIESGSHDSYEEENIKKVFDAIVRLLNHLDILQSPVEKGASLLFSTNFVDVMYSPISGFVKYYISPQEKFIKNQILCDIYTSGSLGKTISIRAPFDGVMFELAKSYITWTGDELVRIIDNKNIKKV